MATKALTASVKLNTKSAEASLNRLARKIKNVQNAINKTSKNNTKLTGQITKAVAATNKLNSATNKVANTTNKVANTARRVHTANQQATNSAKSLGNAYKSAHAPANRLLTTVKRLAATYLGVMGTKAIIGTSDIITSTQNRLNALNGGDADVTQEQMNKMYVSSNKVGMLYTDMLSNASKSMTLAGDAFQGNMDNAIRFQEIMAETYTLGGASAPEMSTSMYQMIQALGSGTLAGDELRSVREGAPLAYKAIEQFAQGIYETDESLKDLAADGKITSEIVVAAIMEAGNRIDAQFNKTEMTFAQAWNKIRNSAVKAFEPVAKKLNEMLNNAKDNGMFDKIDEVFWNVSKALQIIFELIRLGVEKIASAFNWVSENWDWLSKVILTAILIIGTIMAVILFPKFIAWLQYIAFVVAYYVWLGVTALASALKTAAAWAIANWQMLLIIAVILAIIIALIWLADSFEDACGMIAGVVMTVVAFIYNAFVGVINAIIQFAWLFFAEPWIGIFEWVLNVFNGGFNTFGDAVANLLGQIISWFLSLGKVVTKIIDAIFGTNWTDGLNSLQDEVLKWGKNEDAITISREAPEIDRWAYGDAYDTGYEWGYDAGTWIKDKVSGLGDAFSLDNIGEKLGLDFGDRTDTMPKIDDPSMALSTSGIEDLLGDIEGNTADMKDSMDLTNDDLEYLRAIAEMEWRNEFTTAEIHVDMTNHNTVNSDRDLDGIVDYLSDVLLTEMANVAEGVHY